MGGFLRAGPWTEPAMRARRTDRIQREEGAVSGSAASTSPHFVRKLSSSRSNRRLVLSVAVADRLAEFEMQESGVRREHHAPAKRAQLQAIVDVVEVNWKPYLVHAANPQIIGAARQHTGPVTALRSRATRNIST